MRIFGSSLGLRLRTDWNGHHECSTTPIGRDKTPTSSWDHFSGKQKVWTFFGHSGSCLRCEHPYENMILNVEVDKDLEPQHHKPILPTYRISTPKRVKLHGFVLHQQPSFLILCLEGLGKPHRKHD